MRTPEAALHYTREAKNVSKYDDTDNCAYCGSKHAACPALGKKCGNCQRLHHFAAVCRSRDRPIQRRIHAMEERH